MSDEILKNKADEEPNLSVCRRAIHDIVKHGVYTNATKVEVTEFELKLDQAEISVYDLFSYFSDDGGPGYGVSIEYRNPQGSMSTDWLGFVGYDEKPVIELEGTKRRDATDIDVEMFVHLLEYVRGSLGVASNPAETWRGEAEHLQPDFS
jgi:hypothetical protein